MSASPLTAARWAVMPAGGTFNSSTPRWDFVDDKIRSDSGIIRSRGWRGTRGRKLVQLRRSASKIGGSTLSESSPAWMAFWLPYICGGGSATVPTFTNTLSTFDFMSDRTGDVYKFASAKVGKATFRGRPDGMIECTMDVMALTETPGVSFAGAALGDTAAYTPFVHADTVLSIGAQAYDIESFELTFDNGLTPKLRNSTSYSALVEGIREITFRASIPFTTAVAAALYSSSALITSSSGTFTLTNGTVSCAFTFSRLVIGPKTAVGETDEFMYPIECDIVGVDAATDEMSIAVDSTV